MCQDYAMKADGALLKYVMQISAIWCQLIIISSEL
jgi:hypothetical protein